MTTSRTLPRQGKSLCCRIALPESHGQQVAPGRPLAACMQASLGFKLSVNLSVSLSMCACHDMSMQLSEETAYLA